MGEGDEANCFHKRPDGTVLGFVGHVVSVATTQPCHCSRRAATGHVCMIGHGCVPTRVYFLTQAAGQTQPVGHSLLMSPLVSDKWV